MTLSPRDRRAILLGAVGLLIILAGRFVLLPWIDSWKDARRSIAEARVELGEAERQIYRVLGQRRRLEKIYGPAVNKALDNRQSAQVKLIEGVQEVFKTGGVKLTGYDPQRPKSLREVPGVEVVAWQIRAKCKLPQLVKCLAGMRKSETLIIVDWFSVVNNEKKPGELEITMMVATLAEKEKTKL